MVKNEMSDKENNKEK